MQHFTLRGQCCSLGIIPTTDQENDTVTYGLFYSASKSLQPHSLSYFLIILYNIFFYSKDLASVDILFAAIFSVPVIKCYFKIPVQRLRLLWRYYIVDFQCIRVRIVFGNIILQ